MGKYSHNFIKYDKMAYSFVSLSYVDTHSKNTCGKEEQKLPTQT